MFRNLCKAFNKIVYIHSYIIILANNILSAVYNMLYVYFTDFTAITNQADAQNASFQGLCL